jgi:hypothetical protein
MFESQSLENVNLRGSQLFEQETQEVPKRRWWKVPSRRLCVSILTALVIVTLTIVGM